MWLWYEVRQERRVAAAVPIETIGRNLVCILEATGSLGVGGTLLSKDR